MNNKNRNYLVSTVCMVLASVTWLTGQALADDHGSAEAEVRAAAKAFNDSYANNDVDTYFGLYADDAEVFFYGERQDMAAYEKMWHGMMEAGGGVEVNEMSDVVVQMMPGNEVAIVTSFIVNTTRSPEGERSTANAFETDVWQKIDGEWKIVHLHYSEIPSEE